MSWSRNLWGVEFKSGNKDDEPMIIGATWNGLTLPRYDGEPTRALLFCTRKQARAWCRKERIKITALRDEFGWTFSTVKMRENVEKL